MEKASWVVVKQLIILHTAGHVYGFLMYIGVSRFIRTHVC